MARLFYEGQRRAFVCPNARANGQSLVRVGSDGIGKNAFVLIMVEHSLRHSYLQDVIIFQRGVHRHLTYARLQTGPCSQHSSPSHAILASHEQRIAKCALMAKGRTCLYQSGHIGTFRYLIRNAHLVKLVKAQPYRQHMRLSCINLIVGQYERQFGQPDGQCMGSPHNGRRRIVSIVLAHQSRRHINAHHIDLCRIDKLYQSGISAPKGLVKPCTKQGVNYQGVGAQFGCFKLLLYFNEIHFRTFLAQPFGIHLAVLAQRIVGIKQKSLYALIATFAQHTGHSQTIATIVARTRKYNNRLFVVGVFILYKVCHSLCSLLH